MSFVSQRSSMKRNVVLVEVFGGSVLSVEGALCWLIRHRSSWSAALAFSVVVKCRSENKVAKASPKRGIKETLSLSLMHPSFIPSSIHPSGKVSVGCAVRNDLQ